VFPQQALHTLPLQPTEVDPQQTWTPPEQPPRACREGASEGLTLEGAAVTSRAEIAREDRLIRETKRMMRMICWVGEKKKKDGEKDEEAAYIRENGLASKDIIPYRSFS
jgi:hypothetical protein